MVAGNIHADGDACVGGERIGHGPPPAGISHGSGLTQKALLAQEVDVLRNGREAQMQRIYNILFGKTLILQKQLKYVCVVFPLDLQARRLFYIAHLLVLYIRF